MKETQSVSFGIGDILTIVFIVLKLAHVIDWSWAWVLSPIWIPLLIMVVLGVTAFAIYQYRKIKTDWIIRRRD